MTIKDKRDAVVEAAKAYARGDRPGTGQYLIDRVRELKAAETPLKLEGVVHATEWGYRGVELRGQMGGLSASGVTVTINQDGDCDNLISVLNRRSGAHRFRLVLTEIMDDAS